MSERVSRVLPVKASSGSASTAPIRRLVDVCGLRSPSSGGCLHEEKDNGEGDALKAAKLPSSGSPSAFAHSFAAARFRRSQSIDESAASPPGEAEEATMPSAIEQSQARPHSASGGRSEQRFAGGAEQKSRHHPSASVSLARSSALSLSVAAARSVSPNASGAFLSPTSALSAAQPNSAPPTRPHRRSASSLSSTAPLTPPAPGPRQSASPGHGHSPSSAAALTYARRQKKPKAGPVLSGAPSSRLFLDVSDTPAPGAYRSYSAFASSSGKGVRMHERIERRDSGCAPGPGSYSPLGPSIAAEVAEVPGLGWAAASARDTAALLRSNGATDAVLGPGSYDVPTALGSGPAASIRSRLSVSDPSASVPGVGSYSGVYGSTLSSSGGASMASAAERGELWEGVGGSRDGPAPGQYTVTQGAMGSSGPAASIRSRIQPKDVHAGGAAPGSYEPQLGMAALADKQGQGALTMDGQSARQALFDTGDADAPAPGPGSYDLHPLLGRDGPKVSMAQRVPHGLSVGATVTPAPGAYDVVAPRASQGAVSFDAAVPRQELFPLGETPAPGPGAYDAPALMGTGGPAAALRSRLVVADPRAQVPGVGEYSGAYASDTGSASGSGGSGPGFGAMSGRAELFAVSADTALVAPGSYDAPELMGQGPAASIRSRTEWKDPRAALPGVGEYGGAYASTLGQAAAASMDGSRRPELFATDAASANVAPGSYEQPPVMGQGPAARIRSRIAEHDPHAHVPGPGQYEGAHTSTLGQAQAASMAGTQRPELFAVDAERAGVAPGSYSVASTLGSGPAASIRSRVEVVDARVHYPGVGEYHPHLSVEQSSLSGSGGARGAVAMASAVGRDAQLFPVNPHTADAGAYDLPKLMGRAPAAAIRSRLEPKDPHAQVPAPGAYDVEQWQALGSDAPAVRMRSYSERKEELFAHTHTLSQGPAAYNTERGLGEDTPAHSMGVRRELKDERAHYPAPTAYDPHQATGIGAAPAPAALSMDGQSARGQLFADHTHDAEAPGPGAYDAPALMGTGGPAAALRSRLVVADPRAQVPGVGEYSGAYASDTGSASGSGGSGPGFGAMSGRAELFAVSADTALVAPGSYDAPELMGQGPAASIRSRTEWKDPRAALPGVGEYGGAYASTLGQAAAASMDGSRRPELFATDAASANVAPGSYEQPPVMGQGPAARIRSRIAEHDPHAHVPGPGQYEGAHTSTLGQAQAASMAGTQRPELFAVDAERAGVAPGSYSVASTLGSGPAASIRSRVEVVDARVHYPGVGEYHPHLSVEQSSLSGSGGARGAVAMASAVGRDAQLFPVNPHTADAGAYDLPKLMGRAPAAAIRSRLEPKDPHAQVPAPGAYDVEQWQALGSDAPAVRMRSYSERKEELFAHTHTLSQGPAAYNTERGLGEDTPAHSMGVRRELKDERAHYPAPTAYDPHQATGIGAAPAPAALSMDGQSARGQLFADHTHDAEAPGPGAYDAPALMGTGGPAAALRSRLVVADPRAQVPGVGEYSGAYASDTGSASGSGGSGPGFGAMSGRAELFAVSADTALVAPGSYDAPELMGQGPAASIRSRTEWKDPRAALPGVGEYGGAYASTLGQAAAASMDGSRRPELFATDAASANVAPGSYEQPPVMGQGPAARIRSRIAEHDPHAHVPGPGQYEGAHTSTLGQAQAASMAGTQRPELFAVQSGATAAVGSYDLPSTLGSGPAASIRSRLSVSDPSASVPGVGSYSGVYGSTLSSSGGASMASAAERGELWEGVGGSRDGPAPGQYTVTQGAMGSSGPAASIRSRIQPKDVHAGGAAPGSYEPQLGMAALADKQGQGALTMDGQSARQALFDTGDADAPAPGPGSYDLHPLLGRDGPKVSMAPRTADPLSVGATALLTPGPASYDVRYPAEADSRDFTFGGVYRPSATLRGLMDGGGDSTWRTQSTSESAAPEADSYNTSGPGLLD